MSILTSNARENPLSRLPPPLRPASLVNLFYPDGPEEIRPVKVAYRKLLDSVINFPGVGAARGDGGTGYSEDSNVGAVGIERSSHLPGES